MLSIYPARIKACCFIAAGSRPPGAEGGDWTGPGTGGSVSKDTGTLGGETPEEEVFRSFTVVEVLIPHCRDAVIFSRVKSTISTSAIPVQ